jgi:hypothetical protein
MNSYNSPEGFGERWGERLKTPTKVLLGGLAATYWMLALPDGGTSAHVAEVKTVEEAVAENMALTAPVVAEVPPPPVTEAPAPPPPPSPLPPELVNPPCTETTIPWLPETVARWHPYVEQAAKLQGVPPEFLEILMFFETLGKPDATSGDDARGLIQLLPSTAAGIFKELGLPELDLFDPAANILASAKYIRNRLDSGKIDLSQGFNAEAARRLAIAYQGGDVDLNFYLDHGFEALRQGIPGQYNPSPKTARYAERVAQAWDERNLPTSQAYDDLMRTPEGRDAMRIAATVGTPPC